MGGDKLNIKGLLENRAAILFAEIGALIHDLGKLSEEFVRSMSTDDVVFNSFKHEEILKESNFYKFFISDIFKSFLQDENTLITQVIKLFYDKERNKLTSSVNRISFFGQFISKHASGKNLFPIYYLSPPGTDGVDSGIDKMVAEVDEAKQRKDFTYIATAFGYEKKKIALDRLKHIRNKYAKELHEILTEIQNNQNDIQTWIEKRRELFEYTKCAFSEALGETRRPANDVTLWDHSFSVTSLYKAAIAGAVLKEWKKPEDVMWRLLSVSFNGNKFCFNTPKMSDILGRKTLLNKMLDFIRDFLEVVIPIGNEIYRDENCSVFLIPEEIEPVKFCITNELWEIIKNFEVKEFNIGYDGKWKSKKLEELPITIPDEGIYLEEFLQKILTVFSEGLIVPEVKISDEASRGALLLGEVIENRKLPFRIDKEIIEKHWADKHTGHERCRSCGMMPIPLSHERYEELMKKNWKDLKGKEKQTVKAYERGLCDFCLRIAQNRVKDWWNNKEWSCESPESPSLDTTIWIDEVSDENNRVALIYISFDLSKWLDGELLNLFFSKPFCNNEFINFFSGNNKELLHKIDSYENFVQLIKQSFSNKQSFSKTQNTDMLYLGSENIQLKDFYNILGQKHFESPANLFKDLIEKREPNWEKKYYSQNQQKNNKDYHQAQVMLLSLTRKHPSFARIRRIWETVKNFNAEVIAETKDLLKTIYKKRNSERKRLRFEFVSEATERLLITHTYWFKVDKNWHEFVAIKDNTGMIVTKIDNINKIENKSFDVYSEPNKTKVASIKINTLEEIAYQPIIPLSVEPSVCLFFVPLKDAWDVINLIKEKCEVEFNKVQHLLPVNIGFVGFHKRTPLYAVLDAAEKMIKANFSKTEKFTVVDCCSYPDHTGNEFKPKNYTVKFINEAHKNFCYNFTTSLGDPEKEDLYYPYFIVENAGDGWEICIEGKWVVVKHLSQLQEGDNVRVYPSYFDFLWLDSNIRRNDVGGKRKHWFFKRNSPKPYYLKDIENFKKLKKLLLEKLKLTTGQILNAYETMMTRIKEWKLDEVDLPIKDETFAEFVEGIILNIPFRLKKSDTTGVGKINKGDFIFLKDSILSGLFIDFVDMWHTVLKRKFYEREE